MRKWKALSCVLAILAVLTTDAMCFVVGYNYCNLLWGMRTEGWSASPRAAFLLGLPFIGFVLLFGAGAVLAHRKGE